MKYFLLLMIALTSVFASAKNYKGAEIYSTESFLYGKFEMRIQAAPGSGQLSTFFLYRNESEQSTTLWEEIDIEIFGRDTNKFQTNVIVEKTEGTKLMTEEEHVTPTSLMTDYHIYALEWTPDSINWYFDGTLARTEKTNAAYCKDAMSIRFNHWASTSPGWVGAFDTSILPTYQYVDYISYASHTPGTGDDGSDYTLQWTDDFSSFNTSRWAKANWTFGGNYVDFLPANAYIEDDALVLKLHDATPPVVETSLSESESDDMIVLYPNPFTDILHVSANTDAELQISIINEKGEMILSPLPVNADVESTINEAMARHNYSVYLVNILQDGSVVETHQLVKTSAIK